MIGTLNKQIIKELDEQDMTDAHESTEHLIQLFLESSPLVIKRIHYYLDKEEFQHVKFEVHHLKASANLLGAEKLSQFLSKFDSEEFSWEEITAIHQELDSIMTETYEDLNLEWIHLKSSNHKAA